MNQCRLPGGLAAILLVFVAFPGNAQDTVKQAQERLRLADAAYEAGEYSIQVSHLEAALELNPASLRTLYNLACGYALLGDTARALEKLNQLAHLGVDYGMADDPDLVSLRGSRVFETLLSRVGEKTKPVINSRPFATIEEYGLIPEGIAHEPSSGRTFFGSMRNGGIYVLDGAGRVSRFATIDIPGFSAIGLAIDQRREILWAIGTATEFAANHRHSRTSTQSGQPHDDDQDAKRPDTASPAPEDTGSRTGTASGDTTGLETGKETETATGPETRTATRQAGSIEPGATVAPVTRTGVFGFDLGNGTVSARFFADAAVVGFNDVAVAPNGDLYLSGSQLSVLSPEEGDVRPLPVSPVLLGTNGIAVSTDGKTIFTSVYPAGIATIDLASSRARFLDLPANATLYGIDGLYLHEGDLVAIQNGTEPWRIIRIDLDRRGRAVTGIRVLERANPHATATTGAIVGSEILYIGQGPAPNPVPTHVPEPLVPFFGQTLIMTAPLDL